MTALKPEIEAKLFWCWQNGYGIAQSRACIARTFMILLERETIRDRFVEYAS